MRTEHYGWQLESHEMMRPPQGHSMIRPLVVGVDIGILPNVMSVHHLPNVSTNSR